jgi:hypothetical protein
MSASGRTLLRMAVGVVIGYVVGAVLIGATSGYLYLRRRPLIPRTGDGSHPRG